MTSPCKHKFEECGEYTKKGWSETLPLYSCILCGYMKKPIDAVTVKEVATAMTTLANTGLSVTENEIALNKGIKEIAQKTLPKVDEDRVKWLPIY